MRIALFSTQATADDAPDMPLGALSLAGRSLAERQLDLALALGCERIVCVSGGIDRQLLALQHRVEAAGAQFNIVNGPRQLLGLIGASDELVVIADGLLLAPDEAQTALAGGAGVLVLGVEAGVVAGFERIDLNYAWAGVLAMPGRLVERLAELPPDCDAIAGLLRIALQGRVPRRVLPEAVLADERWALIRTRQQVAELGSGWFRRHAAAPDWRAPGRALARLAVRHFGGRLLERSFRPEWLSGLGLVSVAAGVATAWVGVSMAALALLVAGWLLGEGGTALAALAQAGLGGRARPQRLRTAAGWLLDCGLVAILALSLAGTWPERLFAPLMLTGLARVAARAIPARWACLAEDRAVLALALIAAAGFGVLLPAIEVLALALLALLLGLSRRTKQLTQT
jgi:hypothetical protein